MVLINVPPSIGSWRSPIDHIPPGFIKAVEVGPKRNSFAPLAQHAALRRLRLGGVRGCAEGEHSTAEVEGTQQSEALIEIPGVLIVFFMTSWGSELMGISQKKTSNFS